MMQYGKTLGTLFGFVAVFALGMVVSGNWKYGGPLLIIDGSAALLAWFGVLLGAVYNAGSRNGDM